MTDTPNNAMPLGRSDLRADCANCFGLCCTALPFAASADFAANKPAGTPCRHLRENFRCGVHSRLREIGYRGCTVFDCFGAGQRVSQATFEGRDWRTAPELAPGMFEAFHAMRLLHELLWYLRDALARIETESIHPKLQRSLEATEALASLAAEELLETTAAAHRIQVNALLVEASALVRARDGHRGATTGGKRTKYPIRRGADLMGARLRGENLRGADLRGAYLIATDLSNADLRRADLIGADFRDTNLCGADLRESLYLTQFQINAAKGDARTKLPAGLEKPSYWSF
ncbi:pentapeptide repeat-containing protein [Paenibacillus sp. LHD-117]|uniref:pentapeptide repeat-containing protein n=1 Tax=Paenibacillus sp. LHD-117 TaxID=3071412 RepID=UPI0027DFACBF|nr:pentapeptide repeat-containing protein [Paenibacillus sp. LHD-117]MDQ6418832.1 pentapeptide repeat-containing protein [Paenibacillus sp. LHD-117]